MTACLLWLWVCIPPGAWMSVCCECCVLSGRGLCDELITRPEESYRLWWIVVCDLETSWMRSPWPTRGCCTKNKNKWKDLLYFIAEKLFLFLNCHDHQINFSWIEVENIFYKWKSPVKFLLLLPSKRLIKFHFYPSVSIWAHCHHLC